MDRNRFVIGDAVLVKAEVQAYYEPDGPEVNQRKVDRKELPKPKRGQIVGMTRIYTGKYKEGGAYGSIEDGYEETPPYLSVKGCETVWLVRYGMLNRQVMVRDTDAELLAPVIHVGCIPKWLLAKVRGSVRTMHTIFGGDAYDDHFALACGVVAPVFDQKQPEWTKQNREVQRQSMVGVPRDAKGRWLKE